MNEQKEMTTLNPSVAADGEQSLTNPINSILDADGSVNEDSVKLKNDEQYNSEAEQPEMWKITDPTISRQYPCLSFTTPCMPADHQ